jgi:PAS domain S-box-containing protein
MIIMTTIISYLEMRLQTITHCPVLSVFLSSIFLSWRGLARLAIVNVAGLLLPILLPAAIPAYAPLVTSLAVTRLGAALALTFLRRRDQLERDRRTELQVNAERLRLALEAAHMGTWDWDVRADVVIASEQAPLLFGLPASTANVRLTTYLERIHPADRAEIERALADLVAGAGTEHQAIYRVLWPDGSVHWIEEQGRVYRDAAGRAVRVTGTVLDITLRKQAEAARDEAEAALRASERRFRALIDNCADAVALFDRYGRVQYVSPAATRILGYELDTYVGANAFQIIHPEERARGRAACRVGAVSRRPVHHRAARAASGWDVALVRGHRGQLARRPGDCRHRRQLSRCHGAQAGRGRAASQRRALPPLDE